ncbi:MAG: hypothetical protein JSR96_10715 [Proteobacteria bacterium]|nr:hypothetical protein [Pseudomonadota bacterium]
MWQPPESRCCDESVLKEVDRHWGDASERLKSASEYALGALKGLFLANGGAIVGLLTFVGNAHEAHIKVGGIRSAFALFALGLSAVLVAYIAGYVSQAYNMQASDRRAWHAYERASAPEVLQHVDSLARQANRAENIGIGMVVASLVLFITGAFVALSAIL